MSSSRVVYEKTTVDGFRTPRTETMAVSLSAHGSGQRLFVGTNEGQLVLYACSDAARSYNCTIADTLRKQPKDRKPISSLIAVEVKII